MANTLALRTTSLAASAALMGLAILGALSITYTAARFIQTDDGPTITTIEPPVLQSPPIDRPRLPPPPQNPEVTAQETVDAPVAETVASDPVETTGVFDPGPAEITSPRWLQRPRNLARYYPARALDRGVTGRVQLDCRVSTQGALGCAVISETPSGWSFGAAALRIAAEHRMAPAMRDGVAVEGRYRMIVPFALD